MSDFLRLLFLLFILAMASLFALSVVVTTNAHYEKQRQERSEMRDELNEH